MSDALFNTIALSLIEEIGPITAKYLLSYCGSAEEVFKSTKKELLAIPKIGEKKVDILLNADTFAKAEKQMKYIDNHGIKAYTCMDEGYPQRLRNFESSPIVLYHNGGGDLNHRRTIGIVGTRSVTERGIHTCKQMVSDLKKYNVQIISGLAYGVDTCAHKSAVKENMSTIGVMGHGHDVLYPAANRALAQSMLEKGGTLSEFPIESRPDREHFPMRNRIIAMMSDAIIVIESAKKGGSMITADFGNEFNKDVFAVPGRVNDKFSEGCNLLIKSHRANLLESAKDIAYIMRWEGIDAKKVIQKSLFVELDANEQKIVDLIEAAENITIDEINFSMKMNTSELAALMINLEFKGVLKSLPGKKYMLI